MRVNRVESHPPLATTEDPDLKPDVAKLDMAHKIRHSNYNSIWEQQKHFTWLISIILSAQAIVLTGTKLASSDKVAIILIASVMGIVISIIGFRVQRIEGIYFCQANVLFVKEHQAVYPEAETPHSAKEPNKSIPRLIVAVFSGKAGVRDHFQILFLAFIIAFAAIAIYASISL